MDLLTYLLATLVVQQSTQFSVCLSSESNFRMKWRVAYIFGVVVHVDPVYGLKVKVVGYTVCPWKNGPPEYNGVVFKILGRHYWNFYNRI